jgi:hypothetical protein
MQINCTIYRQYKCDRSAFEPGEYRQSSMMCGIQPEDEMRRDGKGGRACCGGGGDDGHRGEKADPGAGEGSNGDKHEDEREVLAWRRRYCSKSSQEPTLLT